MPPITAVAMGARKEPPSPTPRAEGNMPADMAMEVITMGRARLWPASTTAARRSMPRARISMAKSISRMAFLDTIPISISIPISTGIDRAELVTIRAAATPPMARGSEKRMVKGWMTERKSRISTDSTSIRPSSMALPNDAHHLGLNFGVAGFLQPGRAGQVNGGGDFLEAFGGGAQRHAGRQVGADDRQTLAVQTFDRGRAFAQPDIGHGDSGTVAPVLVVSFSERDAVDVFAAGVVQTDPDRHQAVVDGDLGQARRRSRQRWRCGPRWRCAGSVMPRRAASSTRGMIWISGRGRAPSEVTSASIGSPRSASVRSLTAPFRSASLSARTEKLISRAAALVKFQGADVGDGGDALEDLGLDVVLRHRAAFVRDLGHEGADEGQAAGQLAEFQDQAVVEFLKVDRDRGAADVLIAGRARRRRG